MRKILVTPRASIYSMHSQGSANFSQQQPPSSIDPHSMANLDLDTSFDAFPGRCCVALMFLFKRHSNHFRCFLLIT